MVSLSLVENKLLTVIEMAKLTVFKKKLIHAFKAKRCLCDMSTFFAISRRQYLLFLPSGGVLKNMEVNPHFDEKQ